MRLTGITRVPLLFGMLLAAGAALPQESDEAASEPATDAAAPESVPDTPRTEAAEPETVDTDDDSYLDIEDDDFTPSEEIPTDQSITFPTDI